MVVADDGRLRAVLAGRDRALDHPASSGHAPAGSVVLLVVWRPRDDGVLGRRARRRRRVGGGPVLVLVLPGRVRSSTISAGHRRRSPPAGPCRSWSPSPSPPLANVTLTMSLGHWLTAPEIRLQLSEPCYSLCRDPAAFG